MCEFQMDNNISNKCLTEIIYLLFVFTRAPNINTRQGQNVLEILQDCFEEQSKASFLDELSELVYENRNLLQMSNVADMF